MGTITIDNYGLDINETNESGGKSETEEEPDDEFFDYSYVNDRDRGSSVWREMSYRRYSNRTDVFDTEPDEWEKFLVEG